MKKKLLAILLFAACAWLSAGNVFQVEKISDGTFTIKHRGKVLLQNIAPLVVGKDDKLVLKEDYKVLADGSKVWNIWNEELESKFRMEVVEFGDGKSVELSILGDVPAWPKYPQRQINMQIPMAQFKDAPYRGVVGLSRGPHIFKEGVFNDKLPKGLLDGQKWRFLAINGGQGKQITIDFDPIGPSNPCSGYPAGLIHGFASPFYQGDNLTIVCGSATRKNGGMTGCKVILREGVAEDFTKIHVLPHYHYNQHVTPCYYDSFGAVKTGRIFKHLDTAMFDAKAMRGWTAGKNLRKVTGSDGALYSHVAGTDGVLKYVLPGKGLYIFNFYLGNSNKTDNKFDLSINGRKYLEKFSVPYGKIASVNIPFWAHDENVEIKFDGDFIISTLSMQHFISEKEDFSFFRGFWFTEGFEPANAFHSKDYQRPLKLDASVKVINMPVPGQETARPLKEFSRKIDKANVRSPEMAWSWNVQMTSINDTAGTLNEYHDIARMQRLLDEAKKRGTNIFMLSGMHGRHGFPGRLQQQAEDIGRFVDAAHKAGIKVIDHHDATFMENWEQGLRVMAERSGEMAVFVSDFSPTPYFCLANKDFTETYYKYLKNLVVVSKVDGLQIDELFFYRHGCLCFSCREAFERDTNWQLPMNELDVRLRDRKTMLFKIWFTWKKVTQGNWWVGLREYIKDVAPDVFLSTYRTHWEQLQSLPRLNLPSDLTEEARGISSFGTEIMPRNPYYTCRSLIVYRKIYNMLCVGYDAPPIWAWFYVGAWNDYYYCWALSNMLQQCAMTGTTLLERPADGVDFLGFGASAENPSKISMKHAAEAAILLHPNSRDYGSGMDYEKDFGGFAQTFQGCHIPYAIIDPRALQAAGIMKRYNVLIVPGASCLSEAELKVVKEFAANGGTVILTPVSGSSDNWGEARKVWGFKDIFGFEPQQKFHKLDSINLPGQAAVKLDPEESDLYYRYLPLDGKVEGEILLEGVALDDGKKVPLVIGRKYKKGKFYYCANTIHGAFFAREFQVPSKYDIFFNKQLEAFMQKVYSSMAAPAKVWSVKAPRLVLSELYRDKDGLYAAHFLNTTGTENVKLGEVVRGIKGEVWPAIMEDVVFTMRDGNVKTAYAVSPDFAGRKELEIKHVGSQAEITLPKELLKAYTIVYIK